MASSSATTTARPRWTAVPWYPALLAASLVLSTYVANAMSIVAVVRPLLVFVAVAVALTAVFGVLARSAHRGGLLAAFSLLFLYPADVARVVTLIVLALGAAAVVAITLRWRRVERPMALIASALNTVGVALLLVLAANLVIAGRGSEILSDFDHGMSLAELRDRQTATGLADPDRPDVYAIMLDGYPRNDTLIRLFDFDNSAFTDGLAERGFAVPQHNRSNYMYTALTLTSMLNMRHLEEIPEARQMSDLRLLINHSAVFEEFRERGYVVVATASGWESEAMRNADVFCAGEPINDFELNLVGPSLVGRLLELAAPAMVADRDRTSVNAALDCLSGVADIQLDQPRFMFAHVASPHLPIVFTADGSPASPQLYGHTAQELSVTYAAFAEGYTEQLKYLNARVLEAIDEILAEFTTPPIIVVFSDHGSESRLNWDNALLSDLEERFSNFFAAYTPGADDLFGDAPTPVNVFPQLLNHYFGTSIQLSHDGSYVSTVQDRLGLEPVELGTGTTQTP